MPQPSKYLVKRLEWFKEPSVDIASGKILAGKAIAQGLINSTTIVSASLETIIWGTHLLRLRNSSRKSRKSNFVRLDITGNPSATAIEIGDVADFRNLKMGYSDLHEPRVADLYHRL